jgi:lipid II:glycine glycyltransferase (peptidoglycan interpeptide bridge formation enzyme)
VFASFAREELLAAIYVTYVGSAAAYIYGGFADGAERHRPNHVLHLEAIAAALERGCDGYNLGSLSIEGVDQFKLGFGAVPVTRTDTVVWVRRAALYGVMQRLRRQRVGPALEAFMRRRLAGRDAVSRAGSGTAS